MDSYKVRLQPEAVRQLNALTPTIRERVREKLIWLGEHTEEIRHLPLHGDLAGLCKRRVGDYRIIYEIIKAERTLSIHQIGHRREIYDTT